MIRSYEVPVPNKLTECPEPGILFTRDNSMWAYHALKAVRNSGQSIPEQDELCDELAGLLFPPAATPDCPNSMTGEPAIASWSVVIDHVPGQGWEACIEGEHNGWEAQDAPALLADVAAELASRQGEN